MMNKLLILLLVCFSCKKDTTTAEPKILPILTLSPKDAINIEYLGATFKIKLTANKRWSASSDETWVRLSSRHGYAIENHEITIKIDPSKEKLNRKADITFKCHDVSEVITVSQAEGNAIIISEKLYTLESKAQDLDISISTNMEDLDVVIPSDIDWISYTTSTPSTTKTLKNKVVTFKITENRQDYRTVDIIFKSTKANISKTINISQFSFSSNSYQIPVVFHVLYNDITDRNQYIDEGYLKLLLDRTTRLTNGKNDLKINYVLAENDKFGMPLKERGVNRVHIGQSNPEYYDLLPIQYDINKFINVYVYELQDRLGGFANLPYVNSTNPLIGIDDGDYYLDNTPRYPHSISLNSKYIYGSDSGITLAHELGHYLGLYHVFYYQYEENQEQNDYCDDTYTYNRDLYNEEYETSFIQSFSRYDNFKNYLFDSDNIMDYFWTNSNIFTNDQKERMHHIIKYGICVPNIYQEERISYLSTGSIPIARIAF